MSKPTIVKFIKPWNGYGPKEIAGFSAELAERLVQAGVAELNGKGRTEKPQQPKQQQQQQQHQQQSDDSGAADDQDEKKP